MKESCRDALDRAYLVLDGEGTPEERTEIQRHLEECQPCLERHGLDEEVKRVIGRLRGCQPCPPELKTRIAGLLHDA
jgi:mycothiol system anti-sigma-R factor